MQKLRAMVARRPTQSGTVKLFEYSLNAEKLYGKVEQVQNDLHEEHTLVLTLRNSEGIIRMPRVMDKIRFTVSY